MYFEFFVSKSRMYSRKEKALNLEKAKFSHEQEKVLKKEAEIESRLKEVEEREKQMHEREHVSITVRVVPRLTTVCVWFLFW